MQPKLRLDPKLRQLLDDSGRSYEVRNGGSHAKLYIEGRMVSVLPRDGKTDQARGNRNTLAQVKRHLRDLERGFALTNTGPNTFKLSTFR